MAVFDPKQQTILLGVVRELSAIDPTVAASRIAAMPADDAVTVLRGMSPIAAEDVLGELPKERCDALLARVPAHVVAQWQRNRTHRVGTVGRLMDPPIGVLSDRLTVRQAKEALRPVVQSEFVTYGYIVDDAQRLTGVLVMRDLLFAADDTPVTEIMVRTPFSLRAETPVMEAMREVVVHHFPIYPVCDSEQRIIGLVRGFRLFERQAFEITAQPGRMVGVEGDEQSSTPLFESFRLRHPWLQFNLLTALLAAVVVGLFRDTVDEVVALAAFLPVLAGQAGNTGGQALAVTVRAMTLGRVNAGDSGRLLRKEASLGFANGLLVGLTAGVGMYLLARQQGRADALALGGIVTLAMTLACAFSGWMGALVPLTLRRCGADPAMASTIFLTTTTDVASIGMLLGLATWIVL